MGNCIPASCSSRKPVTIALLGTDNAGKTSVLKCLQPDGDLADVAPTVGFSKAELSTHKFAISMYDLGGGVRIRDIWKNYLHELHGIIYVIDSSDVERLAETGELLKALVQHPQIRGKPILLLLNKQDADSAIDEVDAAERFDLQRLVNINRSPCRVETCVAAKGTGRNCDSAIRAGFAWLLGYIGSNYPDIERRIADDTISFNAWIDQQKAERRERVRLKQEEEEEVAQTSTEQPETNGQVIVHRTETPQRHNRRSSASSLRSTNAVAQPSLPPLPEINETVSAHRNLVSHNASSDDHASHAETHILQVQSQIPLAPPVQPPTEHIMPLTVDTLPAIHQRPSLPNTQQHNGKKKKRRKRASVEPDAGSSSSESAGRRDSAGMVVPNGRAEVHA